MKQFNPKINIGILISLAYFFLLLASLPRAGIFWDEPAYFQESLNNLEWIKRPSVKTIDQYWGPVQLSPPIEKYAQAVSYEIFHNRLYQLGNISALKLPNILFTSLTVLAVYFFCLKYFNFQTAVASSLFLALMPRYFGHARLGALDIPVTFFVFLSAWALWHYKNKTLVIPGIILGLALSTKISGYFFLIPYAGFYLLSKIIKISKEPTGKITNQLTSQLATGKPYSHITIKPFLKLLANLFLLSSLPLVTLFFFYPKLWPDPIPRLQELFAFFSTNHNPVPFMYFGKTAVSQPWHFPWVMLAITTPVLTLLFSLLGIIVSIKNGINTFIMNKINNGAMKQWNNETISLFLLLNLLFLPLLFSFPGVSAYDAERLLLPSLPFLAIFASLGLSAVLNFLSRLVSFERSSAFRSASISGLRIKNYELKISPVLSSLFLILSLIPSFSMLLYYYPYPLSAYNSLIGGIKGAAASGMEPQYTLEAYRGTLDYINGNCPKNCLIYAHSNISPFAWYQKDGLLRKDIRLADNPMEIPKEAYYYILPMRKSLFYGPAWTVDSFGKPVYSVKIDGIPIVSIYKMSDLKSIL